MGLLWDERQVEGQLVLPNLHSSCLLVRDKRGKETAVQEARPLSHHRENFRTGLAQRQGGTATPGRGASAVLGPGGQTQCPCTLRTGETVHRGQAVRSSWPGLQFQDQEYQLSSSRRGGGRWPGSLLLPYAREQTPLMVETVSLAS